MRKVKFRKNSSRCQCLYCQSLRATFYNLEVERQRPIDYLSSKVKREEWRKEKLPPAPLHESTLKKRKKELRGTWITTVRNIDFPSPAVYAKGQFNVGRFKQEFNAIIARCKQLKLNAIFFQIRPEGDAFYASDLNPWSVYLTGEQGFQPQWGDFDPLKWMIDTTHEVGIEFHAWFNPYRLTPSDELAENKDILIETLSPKHYARQQPEWTYMFNGQLYLDPGIPEVQEHLISTVQEVLERYPIDAVHLDDYFYPYSYKTEVDGQSIVIRFADENPDRNTYELYHGPGQSIEQWREQNINNLVKNLSRIVTEFNRRRNKQVAFGISPFGVWASAEETAGLGSDTSPDQYSSLHEYVNSRLWVENGWLDYIIPQNYWAFNNSLSSFDKVAKWWNDVVAGTKTQLYIGLGLYLYEEDATNPAWKNPEEIIEQIRYIRNLSNVCGHVFFTYHNLIPIPATDTLKQALLTLKEDIEKEYSIVPPRTSIQRGSTLPIHKLEISRNEYSNLLMFEVQEPSNIQYFVIYRVSGSNHNIDFSDPQFIHAIIGKKPKTRQQSYLDIQVWEKEAYTYGVTALSQAQVESIPVVKTFLP